MRAFLITGPILGINLMRGFNELTLGGNFLTEGLTAQS
jgi:hypothetical protein